MAERCVEGVKRVVSEPRVPCIIVPGQFYEGSMIFDPKELLKDFSFSNSTGGVYDQPTDSDELTLDTEIPYFIDKH